MLGKDARFPKVLFTDRGTGMYSPQGYVVRDYAAAVEDSGFRLYWGAHAKQQSPDMGDVLLHETAVSWVRSQLRKTRPEGLPWEETSIAHSRAARMID